MDQNWLKTTQNSQAQKIENNESLVYSTNMPPFPGEDNIFLAKMLMQKEPGSYWF